jgi:hypothetical protein
MTTELEDDLHKMLLANFNSGFSAYELKSLIKLHHEELYNRSVWEEFIRELKDSVTSYNEDTDSHVSLGDTDALYLALSFLDIGDEDGFEDAANLYSEAIYIK